MKQQYLGILNAIVKMDVKTTPDFIVMVALAKHRSANYPNPELVAAGAKIKVNQEFINDKELFNKTLDTVVSIANNTYESLLKEFSRGMANMMFERMIATNPVEINYTYEN